MKTTKLNLVLLAAILVTPLVYSSCSHPAAAGAATAVAYDNRQDEQKKEDYAKAKKEQAHRKADR
jgi:hypothetical protein